MIMKLRKGILSGILALLAMTGLAQTAKDSPTPEFAKGDFFIVSSIDLAKGRILLKRPTEVTELMRVDGSTHYFEEQGKPIRLTDLRAGDTVYIVTKPGMEDVAVTIHKGPMTADVLRERYLKRPR
jgi:hypothetical protein